MIKIISFLEEHIEKIILAVVGLLCLWLLAAPPIDPLPRVLFSPSVVSYGNRNFIPGAIDKAEAGPAAITCDTGAEQSCPYA
jgi:hypothetical protein